MQFYQVIPRVPAQWQFLPRAFGILRSPDEQQLERGFALIEDLAPKGVMPDLYEGLRKEQAKLLFYLMPSLKIVQIESALVHLAKFHAFSMTFPAELMDRFRIQHYGILKGLEGDIMERVLRMGTPYVQLHQRTLEAFREKHHSLRADVHVRHGKLGTAC